jgi:hypothetical protein
MSKMKSVHAMCALGSHVAPGVMTYGPLLGARPQLLSDPAEVFCELRHPSSLIALSVIAMPMVLSMNCRRLIPCRRASRSARRKISSRRARAWRAASFRLNTV